MVGQPLEFLDKDDTLHNIHPMPKDNPEWNQSQVPAADRSHAHSFHPK
jgi:hypothetical protein